MKYSQNLEGGEIPVHCRNIAAIVLQISGKKAKVLLMQRSKGFLAGLWCQVTGKVEARETHWEAATREVIEETGLQPNKLYSADFCDFFYEPTSNTIEAIPIFVAIVPNDADVKLNDENTAYRWVDLLEAIDLVPFVGHRQALREIHHDFIEHPQIVEWRLIKNYQNHDY